MPKISVIVPVYNTGTLIRECLESLLTQTYTDFEIIIVNDGSTDDSEERILHTIKDKDNCKYIFQENKGLSSARNTGLTEAIGEFIAFVDSDDWVEKEYLELMIYEIEKNNADMCICGYYRKQNNEVISRVLPESKITHLNDEIMFINFYYRAFIEEKYGIICCNKLYRKNLIFKNSLKFEKNSEIYAEDLLFNTRLVLSATKIVEISDLLYNYRIREGSITQSKKPLLEARYSELLRRIEKVIYRRMPNHSSTLFALIQYEAINVITTNAYNFSKSLIGVYKAIKLYENADGKVFIRLQEINTAKTVLKTPKRSFSLFFLALNIIVKSRKPQLLGFLYWLKLSILGLRKRGFDTSQK